MARIRTIKPEFFTSDDIVALSLAARLLYIGLWCEADREGRFEWKPKAFKRRYLPDDDCDIEGVCSELLAKGLVALYGENLAYIPTFSKHQHVNGKETPSRLPSPIDGSVAESFTHFGWRKAIFDRDGNKCVRCGDTDGPHEIDHIIPRSAGGTDNAINLRVLCKGCNRARPVSGEALIDDLRRDGYDLSVLLNDTQYTRPGFRGRVVNASGRVVNASTDATSLPFPSLPSQGGLGETRSEAPPPVSAGPAPALASGALIGRGESVKWQRDQDRLHAAHHPEVCTWRAPGSCRVCLPAAQVAQFADKLVSVAPEDRAATVVAWARAHVPTVAELPANLFRYWDQAWDARQSGDEDGDALHRQTQAFDRRQREIRDSLPPVEVNLKALREGLEAGRASAAAKATGGRA